MRNRKNLTRRRDKGVTFLLFLLVLMPIILFALAISVDISKLITQYNRNFNIAEAAANAGATARNLDNGILDAGEAARRANDLCAREGKGSNCATVNGPEVTVSVPMTPFSLVSNAYGPTIFVDWGLFTSSKTASVCNAYTPTGPSDQYCVRPKSWN